MTAAAADHAHRPKPPPPEDALPAHTHADGSHEEHAPPPLLRVVPARHTRLVHLVRHGEGFHNVAGHKDPEAYKSWDFDDAHLTPRGWAQARALRRHIAALGAAFRPGVVLTSPLTRALETAVGAFGAPEPSARCLMLEQAGVEGRRAAAPAAYAPPGCPPLVAVEACREILGVHPCDRRRHISAIAPCFPAVDFSGVESDGDALWREAVRESHAEIRARGAAFMASLLARPEREIVVVTHSTFLFFMLQNWAAPGAADAHKWFENAEMRSLVLADEAGGAGHAVVNDPLHFPGGHHTVSD